MALGPGAGLPPIYDPLRARHEAAHAVVLDDLGYRVTWVNIRAGNCDGQQLHQMTKVEWGAFEHALDATDWNDTVQRNKMVPVILGYVTNLVAGHVAENICDKNVQRVSDRIQSNQGLLQHPPNRAVAKSDRDRTALFLFLIRRNTIDEVTAAEERAIEILFRRTEHFHTLTNQLVAHGTVEGAMLCSALGRSVS